MEKNTEEAPAPETFHDAVADPSHHSTSSLEHETTREKQEGGNGIENIRTISRVPGNPNYFEKDGLRTYGDGQEHDEELPVSVSDKVLEDVGLT